MDSVYGINIIISSGGNQSEQLNMISTFFYR